MAVGGRPSPERCLRCGADLAVGGRYFQSRIKPNVYEAWCVPCGSEFGVYP